MSDEALRPDPEAQAIHSFKPPASHRDDPDTSRQAAIRKAESGTLRTDSALLSDLILRYPGSTIPELAERIFPQNGTHDFEHSRQRLGRRASELAKAGKIHARGKRDGCQCWWPGPEPIGQADLFGPAPCKWRTD